MALPELLAEARACAVGLADPAPLDEALAIAREPAVIAVLGRTGAGKSSLVARLGGVARPVGLGGVTRSVVAVPWSVDGDPRPAVLLDTPGIDDPDAALVALGPVVDRADAAIWVSDGLQPWTATERGVHALLGVGALPWQLVASRRDLVDEADRVEVAARVGAMTGHAPVWADLRRGAPSLAPEHRPGPHRRARIRAALAGFAAPVVPSVDELRAEVREAARAAVAELGDLRDPAAVDAALAGRHDALVLGLARRTPLPLPDLPAPPTLGRSPGGVRGALVRAAGAWATAADLALGEGWGSADRLEALRARAGRLSALLDAVRARL